MPLSVRRSAIPQHGLARLVDLRLRSPCVCPGASSTMSFRETRRPLASFLDTMHPDCSVAHPSDDAFGTDCRQISSSLKGRQPGSAKNSNQRTMPESNTPAWRRQGAAEDETAR
mmetsp:Transcript_75738/g.245439  ORF Transcript_75738/g.245439 Transcript_75738/m.245439 type:complete len:114 (+) Transcript_75738:840-1181(+)